jgi:hypothetical protein
MITADPQNPGKTTGLNVLRFYPEGDKALYLEYQTFLQRELAVAFDLSPQVLGIERDCPAIICAISSAADCHGFLWKLEERCADLRCAGASPWNHCRVI